MREREQVNYKVYQFAKFVRRKIPCHLDIVSFFSNQQRLTGWWQPTRFIIRNCCCQFNIYFHWSWLMEEKKWLNTKSKAHKHKQMGHAIGL